MSKLQILSPISDKSQEQTSSPSSSPQDQGEERTLTTEVWGVEEWQQSRSRKRNRDLDLTLNLNQQAEPNLSFKGLRTPDIQQLLNVPWDVPKLKKKLQNRNFCFRGQTSSPETSPKRRVHPKSPDVESLLSGGLTTETEQDPESRTRVEEEQEAGKNMNLKFDDFSEVTPCTVVKTPELEAYLEVPWEVPKLRKKLQNRKKGSAVPEFVLQGSDSGISMSSQETKDPAALWSSVQPRLRRRQGEEGGGGRRTGSAGESWHRHTLCLSQPQPSTLPANGEFLVQSYPPPRAVSMVSSHLTVSSSTATERGDESILVTDAALRLGGMEGGGQCSDLGDRLGGCGDLGDRLGGFGDLSDRLRGSSDLLAPSAVQGAQQRLQETSESVKSYQRTVVAPSGVQCPVRSNGGALHPGSPPETDAAPAPPEPLNFGPVVPGDISDLPFSMPKLARRLAQAAPSSSPPQLLKLPKRPSSGLFLGAPPPPQPRPENVQQTPDTRLSPPPSAKYCKQARPSSLVESSQARPSCLVEPRAAPAGNSLQLTLPLQRPGELRGGKDPFCMFSFERENPYISGFNCWLMAGLYWDREKRSDHLTEPYYIHGWDGL